MFIPKRRLFASFWDLSPLEGPPGHINPKTIWDKTLQQLAQSPLAPLLVLFLFCLPLSQSLVAHSSGLFGTSRPVFPLSVFLTCNVGMKIGLSRTFSSGRVTSGNCQTAFQGPLWHFPVFRTCNVGKSMNALLCSYDSCSKSFGESTPNREAYRAYSSPNSTISPRLVKPPPLEGPPRHIAHQTFWDKALRKQHRALWQVTQGF